MPKKLDLQEITVVILANNHNPSLLNPDFLRYNGIVPADWELAQPPITTEALSQVRYSNGVVVQLQHDKLLFGERVKGKKGNAYHLVEIVKTFIETLPHVEYVSVGVNPKGHVLFGTKDEADAFVSDSLLTDGPWTAFGGKKARAEVRFIYELDRPILNLDVKPALIEASEDLAFAVVLFSGNFHYDLRGAGQRERVEDLLGRIADVSQCIDTLHDLVNNHFLRNEN